MRLTKEDKKYLISILERDHESVNYTTIKDCPLDICWHKKLLKELKR